MIVHIFPDTPHHYVAMQGFFECLPLHLEQRYWILGKEIATRQEFRFFSSEQVLLAGLRELPSSVSLVFHGLFSPVLIRNLAFSGYLKRSACILWGAEIYRYQNTCDIKGWLNKLAHGVLLGRVKHVFALNEGDAKLTKATMRLWRDVQVLPYPLIDFRLSQNRLTDDKLRVLLGNSADPSNRHLYLLDLINKAQLDDVEIYVPLNYGGSSPYVDEVIAYGKSTLGERFKPITEMLSKQQYDELLCSVDLSLFGQQRQQGLYVVYAMLLQGKPMFLNKHTSTYQNLTAQGFHLFDTGDFTEWSNNSKCDTHSKLMQENRELMQNKFTESALAPNWLSMLKMLNA
ncbi:TDP-N-acetylfucosamine:lipid II N-acetylfucosaminyltransferase [Pseudoalteromonas sp. T1lg65]|uniref:TDP-N-acetylfucosamine:lipid II N-acetylfucosaminyltransferase n=1 Tax=Pseudoalteromonas sp. T1lg65 TaxID=2077101 RepID=UPI003F79355A